MFKVYNDMTEEREINAREAEVVQAVVFQATISEFKSRHGYNF